MNFSQLFEILFNIAYLITIWLLVGKMSSRRSNVAPGNRPVAQRLLIGFFLLALGDTGHVGFRVWSYVQGWLESKLNIGNIQVPLVGIGSLCTAYTITILYILLVDVWRLRFNKKIGPLYLLIQTVGVLRLIIMLFPQNKWFSIVPPFDWSLYRNIPLTLVGLTLAILLLTDAVNKKDKIFKTFSYLIFTSYFFYLPVILFVRIAPWVGMLMIPKTVAYIFMAIIAYKGFFKDQKPLTSSQTSKKNVA